MLYSFVVIRRCVALSTIIVLYLQDGEKPVTSIKLSTFVLVLGTIIAAFESLKTNTAGIGLAMACNFSQALSNASMKKLSKNNLIKQFCK